MQSCCSAVGAGPSAASPGILHGIFGWWPMLWIMRIGLLTLFGTLFYIYVVNVLRFFRPSSAKAMITGPLPRLRQVGGKIAGVEATASLAENDASTGQQLDRVNQRIDDLMKRMERLAAMVGQAAPGGDADGNP